MATDNTYVIPPSHAIDALRQVLQGLYDSKAPAASAWPILNKSLSEHRAPNLDEWEALEPLLESLEVSYIPKDFGGIMVNLDSGKIIDA